MLVEELTTNSKWLKLEKKLALGRKSVEPLKMADPEPFPNQFTTQVIREKGTGKYENRLHPTFS